MTPWFSLGAALLGAVVGALLASRFTRRREQDADLRGAVADYITASVQIVALVADARRVTGTVDLERFGVLNERTTRTEQTLWLTFRDNDLVPAARAVSRATATVLDRWVLKTDADFLAARVAARDAQIALFEAARRKVHGSDDAGLPPHLSWRLPGA